MEEKEEKAKNKQKQEAKEKKSFSVKLKNYIRQLFDFSNYDTKTIIFMIIFIFLVGISLYLLYHIYFVDKTFLFRLVVEWFVNPIYELGWIGIFLFILVMALQGLLVPIPSGIVLLSAGMIWGVLLGGIIGVIGSMAAGLLCYYISKKGGRPLAEKFVGESALNMADEIIQKYGMGAIIIARMLPFVAFDPVSYAAGLVKMDVKKYSLGTLIGSIPRAFFYAWLGASLGIKPPINFNELPMSQIEQQAALFNNILLIILVVLVIMFVSYYIFSKYWEKKINKG